MASDECDLGSGRALEKRKSMTGETRNTDGERRAGLLGRRFGQDFSQSPDWFEADIRVVDADIRIVDGERRSDTGSTLAVDATPERVPTQSSASTPPVSSETVVERNAAGVLLAPSAFRQQGQALWEIIPPATHWGDKALMETCLAGALRPSIPTRRAWLRWPAWGAASGGASEEVLTLELAGVSHRARLFLRGSTPLLTKVFDHLLATYRDVQRVVLDPTTAADADPLAPQVNEGVSFAELHLERPSILPLKVAELAPDPLTGVIQACTNRSTETAEPLRVVSQLHLKPAPPQWKRRNQAFLEKQRALRAASPNAKSGGEGQQVVLVLAFLLGMVGLFLATHGLLFLLWSVGLPLVAIFGSLGLVFMWRRWRLTWHLHRHEQAVVQKLSQEHVQGCLRLYVLGPADARQAREAALERCIRAYGAYAGLNRWKVGQRGHIDDLALAYPPLNSQAPGSAYSGDALAGAAAHYQTLLDPDQVFHPRSLWQRLGLYFGGEQARPMLGMNEAAALWHLPASASLQPYFQSARDLRSLGEDR